jgi:hypothetical protein
MISPDGVPPSVATLRARLRWLVKHESLDSMDIDGLMNRPADAQKAPVQDRFTWSVRGAAPGSSKGDRMKIGLVLTLAFLVTLALSAFVLEAAPSDWSFEGCWSPFPSCSSAYDIYRDASGYLWRCSRCGTTKNPSPRTCQQVNPPAQYWCS